MREIEDVKSEPDWFDNEEAQRAGLAGQEFRAFQEKCRPATEFEIAESERRFHQQQLDNQTHNQAQDTNHGSE